MKTIQNQPTKLDMDAVKQNKICNDAAATIFESVMRWHPTHDAAKAAAEIIIKDIGTL